MGFTMKKLAATVLLTAALVSPVALFWLFLSRADLNILVAATMAVVVGWALNLAWAFTAGKPRHGNPAQAEGDFFAIAARFGWACPSVLVFLTWLVWHFTVRSPA